jgi:hypothetical protein
VTVSFGAPIPTEGLTLNDREPLIASVRGAVADLLQEPA